MQQVIYHLENRVQSGSRIEFRVRNSRVEEEEEEAGVSDFGTVKKILV
jgi:hypothetical protein